MKRYVSICLLLIFFAFLFPIETLAIESDAHNKETIYLDDGSYFIIQLTASNSRTSFTKAGEKRYTYYNSQDVALWSATLSGMFTYNGTSSTCKNAYCNVEILNNNWYEISNTVSKTGATANADLIIGRKVLGITIEERPVSITLTCDEDGNLS